MNQQNEDLAVDGPAQDDKRFAENMRAIREARNMSQADLVRALKERGWTSVFQTTISRIENGDRPVRYGEARAIARALGANVEQFLLAPEDQALALQIREGRDHLGDSYAAIRADVREHIGRAIRLRSVVEGAQQAGHTPTELPDDPDVTIVPITVADELALALEALNDQTVERAAQGGRTLARLVDNFGDRVDGEP